MIKRQDIKMYAKTEQVLNINTHIILYQYLYYTHLKILKSGRISPYYSLDTDFTWRETIQGHTFWSKIDQGVENYKVVFKHKVNFLFKPKFYYYD